MKLKTLAFNRQMSLEDIAHALGNMDGLIPTKAF